MIRAFFVCNMGTTNLGRLMFLSGLEAEDYPTRGQYEMHLVEHNAPIY